jgi:hypothetical protein
VALLCGGQPPAFGFEITRKRGETSAQEFLPRRAAPMMIASPFAEHEQRHYLIMRGGTNGWR